MTTGAPGRGRAGPPPAGPVRPGPVRPAPTGTGGARPSRRARAPGGPAGREGPQDRFGLLLLVLITTYLLSAFTTGAWVNALQIVLVLAVAVLAVRTGRMPSRTAHTAVAVAIGGSVIAVVLGLAFSADVGAGLARLWTALVLLFAVGLIVRRVLSHPVVTLQSIFGAVSAYLVIGLMFAAVFSAMNDFTGGTFFVHGEQANVNTFQYFSFTTLTTLGYGDFTSAESGGRAVAVMEALLGQVFLATLVARLVAAFRPTATQLRPGGRALRRGPVGRGRRRPGRARPRQPEAARGSADGATRTSSRARARPARRSPPRPGR